ncbi:putative 50S ribosomal protein L30 [Saitoella complicata NRRL Y-17804]|uniref:putative 50S ribosomal protein L30 n=1 Tax=Saitoella complicata (strain BCRC 22490 / CBS 7301 / JCM 7358 / NBRC 10748 / NRRL Y-17804) TaxID=698492 RepID=UPI0008674FBF|nr:putative 50S ribosomal protein L30 [Saitoella complicata NRRL Y-17804]ODQ50683.1 putative 50S ribosomal protein L30 [Saitoella complicata NRRL Y-17804]
MPYFRLQLVRSAIGLPAKTTRVLKSLGLRKRMSIAYKPVSSAAVGAILKVKELVTVEEAERPMTIQEIRKARSPPKGYEVEEVAQWK